MNKYWKYMLMVMVCVSLGLFVYRSILAQTGGYFYLPWQNAVSYVVTQGNNSNPSHTGSSYYAYDFKMPEGQLVLASAGGRISHVRSGNVLCGNIDYAGYANLVVIDHFGSNVNSSTLYAHLKDVYVTEGQYVSAGTLIGTSGKTGFTRPPGSSSCGPHLHFQREDSSSSIIWTNSQLVYFQEYPGEILTTVHDAYVSENQPVYEARLFEHSYFSGDSWGFSLDQGVKVGEFNVPLDQNDLASSIVMPHTWSVDVFRDIDQSGPHKLMYYDDSNLTDNQFSDGSAINDNISSLRVYKEPQVQFGSIGAPTPVNPTYNGWEVEYFNYEAGNPSNKWSCGTNEDLVRTYPFKDWSNDAPSSGCNTDFIARFFDHVYFEPGEYTAYLYCDDSCRLNVLNSSPRAWVVDRWDNTTSPIENFTIDQAGYRDVTVEFRDNAGNAWLQAWWEGPGNPAPADALFPPMVREVRDIDQWYEEAYGIMEWPADSVFQRNYGNALPFSVDWGTSGPGYGLPEDQFATKFDRLINFECGTYDFVLNADDYAEMVVDPDSPLMSLQTQYANNQVSQTGVSIPAGNHLVRVRHKENGGDARLSFDWTMTSACPTPTPTVTPNGTATPTPTSTSTPISTATPMAVLKNSSFTAGKVSTSPNYVLKSSVGGFGALNNTWMMTSTNYKIYPGFWAMQ